MRKGNSSKEQRKKAELIREIDRNNMALSRPEAAAVRAFRHKAYETLDVGKYVCLVRNKEIGV